MVKKICNDDVNEEILNDEVLKDLDEFVEKDSELINFANTISTEIGKNIIINTINNFNFYLDNKNYLNEKIKFLIKKTYLKKLSIKITNKTISLS